MPQLQSELLPEVFPQDERQPYILSGNGERLNVLLFVAADDSAALSNVLVQGRGRRPCIRRVRQQDLKAAILRLYACGTIRVFYPDEPNIPPDLLPGFYPSSDPPPPSPPGSPPLFAPCTGDCCAVSLFPPACLSVSPLSS